MEKRIAYLFKETYRKLDLAKMAARMKGKELIDLAVKDLKEIEKLWKNKS